MPEKMIMEVSFSSQWDLHKNFKISIQYSEKLSEVIIFILEQKYQRCSKFSIKRMIILHIINFILNNFFAADTIYNMVKLQEGEVDEESEKPMYPNKILRTRVINNPFPDIEPRESIQMIRDDDESEQQKKKKKSKMKATKDFNLISFGDEAEEEENDLEVVQKSYKNKSKSSHDLLNDPKLLAEVGNGKEINENDEGR